jgi:hypothetical protein
MVLVPHSKEDNTETEGARWLQCGYGIPRYIPYQCGYGILQSPCADWSSVLLYSAALCWGAGQKIPHPRTRGQEELPLHSLPEMIGGWVENGLIAASSTISSGFPPGHRLVFTRMTYLDMCQVVRTPWWTSSSTVGDVFSAFDPVRF